MALVSVTRSRSPVKTRQGCFHTVRVGVYMIGDLPRLEGFPIVRCYLDTTSACEPLDELLEIELMHVHAS